MDFANIFNDKKYQSGFSLEDEMQLAARYDISLIKLEETALTYGIVPERYKRNIGAISINEQIKLLNSRVGVIGCGGLGGYLIEELARLGVGTIQVWDYDVFQESNLNRQIMCDTGHLECAKIDAARNRISKINPAVEIRGIYEKFNEQAGLAELKSYEVLVDALDSINSRLDLSRVGNILGIPLVHGAIDGWYGQVCTQFPGDGIIEQIYGTSRSENSRDDYAPSVLSFTPAIVASVQAAEVVKVLLGKESLLRGKLMLIDLLEMDNEIVDIKI